MRCISKKACKKGKNAEIKHRSKFTSQIVHYKHFLDKPVMDFYNHPLMMKQKLFKIL